MIWGRTSVPSSKKDSMAKKDEVRLQVLAVADQVIEAKDGKKSLIGLFDRIFVQNLPSTHPRMTLFITLVGEVDKKDAVSFVVEKPSGKQLSENTIDFVFGKNGKADLIINLEGFPIEEIGAYKIILKHAGKELSEYLIQVSKVQEQNAGSTVIN